MKPFKIKAIKTYVSYLTTFIILHNMRPQKENKMASSEDAVQYSLKDKLIRSETVLYLFYDTNLPRKPRNLEA